MTDEFRLRTLARNLENAYRTLEVMKHARTTPPEVRVMRPTPGPQPPGNWLYIATFDDQYRRLREVAFNAFHDIHVKLKDDDAKATRLCHLIAYHAQAISQLDWADDLRDELENELRVIGSRCEPKETTTIQRAERIKQHLARKYSK